MRTAADLADSIRELVVDGRAAWTTRDYERARRLFEQVLRVANEADDRFGQTAAYHFLGNIAFNERRDSESREHHARALALARTEGDYQGIGTSLASLALIEVADENFADAQKPYEEAISAATKQMVSGVTITCLGILAESRGYAESSAGDFM